MVVASMFVRFPLVFQFLTSFNGGQQQPSNKKIWAWKGGYIAQKPENEVLPLLRAEFDRSEGQRPLQHQKPACGHYRTKLFFPQ